MNNREGAAHNKFVARSCGLRVHGARQATGGKETRFHVSCLTFRLPIAAPLPRQVETRSQKLEIHPGRTMSGTSRWQIKSRLIREGWNPHWFSIAWRTA